MNQPQWDYVGLFGYVGYNPEVKNLTITDSTFIGNHYVGALAGYAEALASNIAIGENVTVQGNAYTGTMVGYNASEIRNSYAYSDSFVGYMYSGYGSIENCYFLSETDDEYGTIGKTAEQFASGEVAYLLQAGVPEEDVYDEEWNWIESYVPEVWGQTIGVDPYPVLGGPKVYQAPDCTGKDSYSNNEAGGHNYVNGTCIHCGEADPTVPAGPTQIQLKFYHTMNFDADLKVNFRFAFDELEAVIPNYVLDGAYLEVEKDHYSYTGEKTVEKLTVDYVINEADNRLVFPLTQIQSVEMGSELRAVLHIFDEDGKEYVSQVDVYSVLTYVTNNLAKYDGTNEELCTLLVDVLNYGAAAQIYFDRRTDELVNAGIDAYQHYASQSLDKELTATKTVVTSEREITAVEMMNFSMNFDEMTKMNVKLRLTGDYSKSDITAVKVYNAEGELVETFTSFTELEDGRLQVTYTGVKSVMMRDMFYFEVYVGEQLASDRYGYSMEAYAKTNVDSTNTKLADMVLKCMYYGDSAAKYFATK